nr:hypothetical protein [Clostridia bacterium]
MSKLLWNRFVSMLLAAIMLLTAVPLGAIAEEVADAADDAVVVTDETVTEETTEPAEETEEVPAEEEPAPVLTECEKLQARVDRLLVRYLGGQFDDGMKSDEEILAAVNGMNPGEIATVLSALSDSQFDSLWQEITSIKNAAKELDASESASVLNRGQFEHVCDIAQSRKNAQAAQPTATPAPVVDEPVVDEPVDEPVVDEPVDEPVVDEPVVDEPVVDEPVVDEPVVDEPVVDEPVVDEPVVD